MDSIFRNQKIEDWVALRILNFLNAAQSSEDIAGKILDNPQEGGDTTIGTTVAARILEKRDSLPFGHFTSIEELEDIAGLGEDKINDFIFTLGVRAADAFKKAMYNGVISDNWTLEHYTTVFETEEDFYNTANIESNLTAWVAEEIEKIALKNLGQDQGAYLAKKLLQKSYLDRYDVAHFGSYAFAFWFYQFASDNWFTFERVRTEIESYLNYYAYLNAAYEQQFLLFKGFTNNPALVQAISQPDLPMVINPIERAITIWTAELRD